MTAIRKPEDPMSTDLTQRANEMQTEIELAMEQYARFQGDVPRAYVRQMVYEVSKEAARAEILRDALLDMRARFEPNAEADAPDTEGYRPNEAMRIVATIDAALKRAGVTP